MAKTDTSKCQCWKRPFEPPNGCYDYCAGKIIRYASAAEMQTILRLTPEFADRLFSLTANDELVLLSDFKPFLTEEEFTIVIMRLQSMSDADEKWLKKKFSGEENAETEASIEIY